jgi:choline dehydrogenase-like flavoprotein
VTTDRRLKIADEAASADYVVVGAGTCPPSSAAGIPRAQTIGTAAPPPDACRGWHPRLISPRSSGRPTRPYGIWDSRPHRISTVLRERASAGLALNVADGERQSAADAYIRPLIAVRPNLMVVTGALAQRLVLTGGRCTGDVYTRGCEQVEVHATGEVVLCAGLISDKSTSASAGAR